MYISFKFRNEVLESDLIILKLYFIFFFVLEIIFKFFPNMLQKSYLYNCPTCFKVALIFFSSFSRFKLLLFF